MADQRIEFWCYIAGQRGVFDVSTLYGGTVANLRRQIYNENQPYFDRRRLCLSDLTLTKVRYIVIPMRTLIY